jgi:hypothetical protein
MDDFYLDGVIPAFDRVADSSRWVDERIVDGLVNTTGKGGVLLGNVSGDVDQVVVDGAVQVTADLAQGAGAAVSTAQSGRIRNYLAGAVGVTAVVVCAVLLWLWV